MPARRPRTVRRTPVQSYDMPAPGPIVNGRPSEIPLPASCPHGIPFAALASLPTVVHVTHPATPPEQRREGGSQSLPTYYRYTMASPVFAGVTCPTCMRTARDITASYGSYITTHTIMANEETALGRRLTFQEAYTMWTHITGYEGVTQVLSVTPGLRLADAIRHLHRVQLDRDRTRADSLLSEEQRRELRLQRNRALDHSVSATNQSRRIIIAETAPTDEPSPHAQYDETIQAPAIQPNGRYACGCYPEDRCSCNGAGIVKSPRHGIPFLLKKTAPGIRRTVGAEVEYNTTTNLSHWVMKWNGAIHRDGSCGWEAVTTPLAGPHIDACLRDLARSLRNNNVSCDERCGVHVHVDASDITWPCMLRLLKVYAKVEPLLYLIGGQHRMADRWCKPCGKDYAAATKEKDAKEAVLSVAFRESIGVMPPPPFGLPASKTAAKEGPGRRYMNQRPGKKDGGRYKGLNIIPWLVGRRVKALDSTVEFRIHRNSLDGRRIAGWAHVCAAIVEWASKASAKDVENLPKSALRALCTIAPDSKRWILSRIADWRWATTAEKRTMWNDGGVRPQRRIKVTGQNGVWSCAV